MSEPVPAILHLYLPPSRLSPEDLGEGFDATAISSLRHEGGFRDPLLSFCYMHTGGKTASTVVSCTEVRRTR